MATDGARVVPARIERHKAYGRESVAIATADVDG
jgi:hypothetical protein